MAGFSKFEDIEAWQAARRLNQQIWSLIRDGAFGRDYGLVDQVNRAAGSAMDNIAEGFDSGSDPEFCRFLRYSQRSCSEARSQLYRALDRGHIDQNQHDEIELVLREVYNKTGGLIRSLKR